MAAQTSRTDAAMMRDSDVVGIIAFSDEDGSGTGLPQPYFKCYGLDWRGCGRVEPTQFRLIGGSWFGGVAGECKTKILISAWGMGNRRG
jgi:hypothetical protein